MRKIERRSFLGMCLATLGLPSLTTVRPEPSDVVPCLPMRYGECLARWELIDAGRFVNYPVKLSEIPTHPGFRATLNIKFT